MSRKITLDSDKATNSRWLNSIASVCPGLGPAAGASSQEPLQLGWNAPAPAGVQPLHDCAHRLDSSVGLQSNEWNNSSKPPTILYALQHWACSTVCLHRMTITLALGPVWTNTQFNTPYPGNSKDRMWLFQRFPDVDTCFKHTSTVSQILLLTTIEEALFVKLS